MNGENERKVVKVSRAAVRNAVSQNPKQDFGDGGGRGSLCSVER